MLPTDLASLSPPLDLTWTNIARACRRICILRELGQNDEAEAIRQGLLTDLVAGARAPHETDAAIANRLDSIFAVEADRVATAAAVAELLRPTLSALLRSTEVPAVPRIRIEPHVRASSAAVQPSPPRVAENSIADFIDAMIAQETTTAPQRSRNDRRAS